MKYLVRAALLAALCLGASAPPGEPRLKGLSVFIHVARSGDTVVSLVRKYNTSKGSLETLNPGLNLDALKPGDQVKVMSAPGVFQKVQQGLTVYDVSRAYDVNAEYLLRVNEISDPRRLAAGTELFIPDAEPLLGAKMRKLLQARRARAAARPPRSAIGKPLDTDGSLVISDGYGMRRHPITREYQMHAGVDIVAPWGTPVLAVRDGVVEFAGWKGGYGKLVILRHASGMESYYGHCTELLVKDGDVVAAGTPIAKVGATGDATAPHLHFELRMDGSPRNPTRSLSRYF